MQINNGDQDKVVTMCEQLPTLTGEVVQAMHRFRQTKDKGKLDQAAQWVQRALTLEQAHEKWLVQATKLVNEGKVLLGSEPQPLAANTESNPPVGGDQSGNREKKYGGKQRADMCRTAYLRREASTGNNLISDTLRGPYFRNGRGHLVGVAFSSDLGNRWWVNFKKECEEVVMLCDGQADALRVLHLTRLFFQEHGKSFHSGDDGLIQITVRIRNGQFYAQIPGSGQVDVTNYLEPEALICKRHDDLQFA
jgi:hypothetical protein